MNENEIVAIPNFPDYGITRDGVVYSHKGRNWRKLSFHVDKDGYIRFALTRNGIRRHYGQHYLVALAFIPNPDNLPIVNHKNEIKNDNRIENLEWCTYSYNATYNNARHRAISTRNRKYGQKKLSERGLRKISKEIIIIDTTTNESKTFNSIADCSKYFGWDGSVFYKIKSGVASNKYRKYKVMYKNTTQDNEKEN